MSKQWQLSLLLELLGPVSASNPSIEPTYCIEFDCPRTKFYLIENFSSDKDGFFLRNFSLQMEIIIIITIICLPLMAVLNGVSVLWNVYGECDNWMTMRGHTGAVMEVKFSTDDRYSNRT